MDFTKSPITNLLVLFLVSIRLSCAVKWDARFENETISMDMGDSKRFTVNIKKLNKTELIESNATIRVLSSKNVLKVSAEIILKEIKDDEWIGSFNADAIFIGKPNVYVEIVRQNNRSTTERSSRKMHINIMHKNISNSKFLIHFNRIVMIFYFVMYVNTGIVLNFVQIKAILWNPLKPCIALACNFILTPLLSFMIGLTLFPNNYQLRFTLFICGLSLLGGGLIFWTEILGGHMDLSVTMSTLNQLIAFGIVTPLWVFAFGHFIFNCGNLSTTYNSFAVSMFYFIVPHSIGALVQYFYPRAVKNAVESLTWITFIYIIFYDIVSIVSYWDMFAPKLFIFTWKFYLAAFLLPSIAYCYGWIVAMALRKENKDRRIFAMAALDKNANIVNSIMFITLFYPQTDIEYFLSVLVVIITQIPLIGHQLYDLIEHQLDSVKDEHNSQIVIDEEKKETEPEKWFECTHL